MLRKHQLTGALALALLSTQAYAQDFSAVISFGDSLTDAGNRGSQSGLPAGSSFTTNPDPIYAQIVAAMYGLGQTNNPLGTGTGTNYAYGGACSINNGTATAAGAFACVNDPAVVGAWSTSAGGNSLANQLGRYLTPRAGVADPNALYTVWSGANDLFTALGSSATAGTVVGQAALTTVANIQALQNAGANTIVVFNLPNVGATPQFSNATLFPLTAPASASVTQLSTIYNTTFNNALAGLGDGIVPINVYALIEDIRLNPSLYGFTNVTGIACNGSSVACYPSPSPTGVSYAPGTNETFLFADGVHPSGAAHRMLANVVYSTLEAPQLLSTIPQDTLMTYEDHALVISSNAFGSVKEERADGDLKGFANWAFGGSDSDSGASAPSLEGDRNTFTLGADYRFNDAWSVGAAVSFGNPQTNGAMGGNDAQVNIFSIYGVRRFGDSFYLNGSISGGSGNNKVTRYTVMGPTVRNDQGETGSSHVGAELGGGFVFGDDSFQHGPFARVAWQRVEVEAYSEASTSTSMRFFGFERESLSYSLGYSLSGNFEIGSKDVRPYFNVSYNGEDETDATVVRAGSTSMNGTFTREGYIPSDEWYKAALGVGIGLTDNVELVLGAHGRFGDDQTDDMGGNIGINIKL